MFSDDTDAVPDFPLRLRHARLLADTFQAEGRKRQTPILKTRRL